MLTHRKLWAFYELDLSSFKVSWPLASQQNIIMGRGGGGGVKAILNKPLHSMSSCGVEAPLAESQPGKELYNRNVPDDSSLKILTRIQFILSREPVEVPPHYVPLHPHLPPTPSDAVHTYKVTQDDPDHSHSRSSNPNSIYSIDKTAGGPCLQHPIPLC